MKKISEPSFHTRSSSIVFDDSKVTVQPTQDVASHLLKKVGSRFRLSKISDWRLHANHPLLSLGFENVISDASSSGPYAIHRPGILLITCPLYETSSSRIHPDLKRLLLNHIRFLSESLISRDKSKFSLTNILFGTTVFRSSLSCTKSILLPAKSTVKVPTAILPHGPTRLKLESASSKALGSLVKKKLVKDSERYPVMHTETSLLPRVMHGRLRFQDPRQHRAKRFSEFLEKQNYEVPAMSPSFTSSSPLVQSHISEVTLSHSMENEDAYQKSAGMESNDPSLESSHGPESVISREDSVPRSRSNRPTTALSKRCEAIIADKRRRPVSATVLAMRLPLHHPLSDSFHELTVVLSPVMGANRFSPRAVSSRLKKRHDGHFNKPTYIG